MSAIPEYFEAALEAGGAALGGFGSVSWRGQHHARPDTLETGRIRLFLRAPKLRVYDIWAETGDGWVQMSSVSGEPDTWANPSLAGIAVRKLRIWVGATWDMTLEPAPPRRVVSSGDGPSYTPPVDAGPDELPIYVPIVEGEPPLPEERQTVDVPSRVRRWVRNASRDIVVNAFLEEWTLACAEAATLGWMVGMPRGEDLLEVYSRSFGADRRISDHDSGFARWMTIELGRATRTGLADRRELESRRPGMQRLQEVLMNLGRALSDDLVVLAAAPPVVGDANRHEWLVDEDLAARLDNPVLAPGSHRPMAVIRPCLVRDGRVLVEGEVV